MKRSLIFIIPIIVLAVSIVVIVANLNGKKAQPVQNPQNETVAVGVDNEGSTKDTGTEQEGLKSDENVIPMDGKADFKEADVDLDGDGTKEKIEIVEDKTGGQEQGGIEEVTGRLLITGSKSYDISFVSKPAGLTGIMSGINFTDLDGDGVKDIFISIPDTGNPFTLNSLFMFNYKNEAHYTFPGDENDFSLESFSKDFSFTYKGNGILEIKNEKYNFSVPVNLKKNQNIVNSEDVFKQYEGSWVDPTPVELSDDTKLMLVEGKDKKVSIKMPLAIYGTSTSDVIGDIELYFDVDSSFKTVFKKFSVYCYDGNKKVKVGEAEAGQVNKGAADSNLDIIG